MSRHVQTSVAPLPCGCIFVARSGGSTKTAADGSVKISEMFRSGAVATGFNWLQLGRFTNPRRPAWRGAYNKETQENETNETLRISSETSRNMKHVKAMQDACTALQPGKAEQIGSCYL